MKLLNADIIVVGDQGELALVEVKNVPHISSAAASSYVQNVFGAGFPANARYVMLVSQEKVFLWDNPQNLDGPVLELDVKPIFDHYLKEGNISGWLRGEELKTLAFHWIHELAHLEPQQYGEIERQLARFNFMSTVRNANVTMGIV